MVETVIGKPGDSARTPSRNQDHGRHGRLRRCLHVGMLFGLAAMSGLVHTVRADVRMQVFGNMNFISSSGSSDSYEPGENEFPLTDAHRKPGFGLGISLDSGRFFYGAEIHYNLSGTATLSDPSDGDTVSIDTSRNAAGLVTVGFNLLRARSLRLFLEGGGGLAVTLDKDIQNLTSSLGFAVEIAAPDREFPVLFFAGCGVEIPMSDGFSFLVGARYQYWNFSDPQTALVARAGLSLGF